MTATQTAGRGLRRAAKAREAAAARPCAWPGCARPGIYRAPKSRAALRDFHWFCLEHVRAYNAEWNYFDGMDAREIEGVLRRDATWHRPTWPLGARGRPAMADAGAAAAEAAERAAAESEPANGRGPANGARAEPPRAPPSPRRRTALASLGLDGDPSPGEVKARYKTLAKRHHPDANGGCKRAEERLKSINEAYAVLRDRDEA